MSGLLPDRARTSLRRTGQAAVRRGLPSPWVGYRWVRPVSLDEVAEELEVLEPDAVADNPLPANVASPLELPDDRGWWGYSFRDVPTRRSGHTRRAVLRGARLVAYGGPGQATEFHPALLMPDGRSVDLREVKHRTPHAPALRNQPILDRDRVTWIAERVYHNHSHWLTAHLPKLLLLQERGELADVLLPIELPAALAESLLLCGIDPARLDRHEPGHVLRADRLTVLETDRFRPELLSRVQRALSMPPPQGPTRRVFISRAGATRRRLLDEDDVWPLLADAGFERVRMEDLSFRDQVALMSETRVLVGLHGAGLTNMLACPPGADVVEIADLSFPNPNFYAVAAAAGHRYWLMPGRPAVGPPLERDVSVGREPLTDVLQRLALT